MWKAVITLAMALAGGFMLTGCKGMATSEERSARQDVKSVREAYRTNGQRPKLHELTAQASLEEFLRFALLNHPQIEAAYYDWTAAVERITVERSLPDPKLTFESDIADIVMTVMPGLMQEFPGPGKLKAKAAVASAESKAKYFTFESVVLQTAFSLKRAAYELHFLDERLRINHQTLALLGDLERIARAQNEVGKATLQDVLRAQIELDRVRTEIANLEDSRRPRFAAFKAALGLTHDQADPPVPAQIEMSPVNPEADELLHTAFSRNPRLKQMEAEVRAAQADITMAYKEKMPDFSLGLMADAQAAPTMFRPQVSMTLPVWRDKLAAEVAQAEAGELAARARLSAEQIALTVDFAEQAFAAREIQRNLSLLQDLLVPKTRLSLEIARAGYLAGTIDFFNLIDTERNLLNFELAEVEARTQREIVLSELSLIIAGVPPKGAPLLKTQPPTSKPTP